MLREAAELTNDARRDIPSTFICTGFTVRAVPGRTPASSRTGRSSPASPSCANVTWVDLPTSHWPMWSRPRELAAIIGDVAKAHARGDR